MYTVIVVEDESELRKSLIRKIAWEEIGFQVIDEAENGIEALDLVAKLEPDLLLTDVKMPYMTGIELARQVREIRPTMEIAFLSGYDDFLFAQQAIQYNIVSYMVKPISSRELTNELYKIKKKIDEKFNAFSDDKYTYENVEILNFTMPLILDSFQVKESSKRELLLREKARTCGLITNTNHLKYVVMVTSFWGSDGENYTIAENVNAIGLIINKYLQHTTFFTDNKIVTLLVGSSRDIAKYLHILVEEIVQSAERIMKLESRVGISREISELQQCHRAYIEAIHAMEECNKEDGHIKCISDLEPMVMVEEKMIQELIDEIENKLKMGSEKELVDALKQIEILIEERKINTSKYRAILIQLIASLYRVIYIMLEKENIGELQELTILQSNVLFERTKESWQKYVEYCLITKKEILAQKTKSNSDICDRAIAVIEQQYYKQELSLVSLSEEISISPNYLSSLIKKSTGSTFIDLLTKKRIETAQNLLLNSGLKIREISEQCGYNDQHYFSYCFKKIIGISPNAYRRLHNETRKSK